MIIRKKACEIEAGECIQLMALGKLRLITKVVKDNENVSIEMDDAVTISTTADQPFSILSTEEVVGSSKKQILDFLTKKNK